MLQKNTELLKRNLKKAEDHAKNIIAEAIQRFASEVVGEETIHAVSIPNEEMKGRLIGRDGRNIRGNREINWCRFNC